MNILILTSYFSVLDHFHGIMESYALLRAKNVNHIRSRTLSFISHNCFLFLLISYQGGVFYVSYGTLKVHGSTFNSNSANVSHRVSLNLVEEHFSARLTFLFAWGLLCASFIGTLLIWPPAVCESMTEPL